MLKGNKGEWSEVYALLKVLGDREIYAGDSNLNKIEKLLFPVIKVLRDETNGTYSFELSKDLVIIKGGGEEFRLPLLKFKEQAFYLLSKLKETTSSTFSIPEVENFIKSFGCESLKAKSSVKSDIRIVIHDLRTGTTPELGFSIKSQLGGASTLLNAGKTTNFNFVITGRKFSREEIIEINQIDTRSKIKDRIDKIKELGGKFNFLNTDSPIFENNLVLIDSLLPKIMAEIVYLFYTSNSSSLRNLVDQVALINPVAYNLDNKHPYYEYKVKRLLTDIALGMMPSKVWTGQLDATGGVFDSKR
ncbi:MAG: HpaII family restriction endonuclease [Chitinophagales bacterium]